MTDLSTAIVPRPPAQTKSRALLPTAAVAARYSCSRRTVERWEADRELDFPRPLRIKRRKYFYVDELDAFDARQAERG